MESLVALRDLLFPYSLEGRAGEKEWRQTFCLLTRHVLHRTELAGEAVRIAEEFSCTTQQALGRPMGHLDSANCTQTLQKPDERFLQGQMRLAEVSFQIRAELKHCVRGESPQAAFSTQKLCAQLLMLTLQQP